MSAGMAADPVAAARIKRTGLGIIPPALGISAMAAVLRVVSSGGSLLPARLAAAVPVDWQHLLGAASDTASLAFFDDFLPAKPPPLAPLVPHQRHRKPQKAKALVNCHVEAVHKSVFS